MRIAPGFTAPTDDKGIVGVRGESPDLELMAGVRLGPYLRPSSHHFSQAHGLVGGGPQGANPDFPLRAWDRPLLGLLPVPLVDAPVGFLTLSEPHPDHRAGVGDLTDLDSVGEAKGVRGVGREEDEEDDW